MSKNIHTSDSPSPQYMRKVAAASAIGTTIEWYDFLIYATAASLVFNQLFFPAGDPLISNLLAISTIGVGFFARPIGSIIFSHFGDRVGRKSMLVITLVMMGSATALIGVLPTYASIGIAAPILLVILRLIQGIAVGGEWGGAVLLCVEHAPPHRRGLFGSLVQIGFPLGMALGTLTFFGLVFLSEEQFLAWGWRVPFLISTFLVLVGLFVRLKIEETKDFQEAKEKGDIERFPVISVLKNNGKDVLLALGVRITEISWIYVITIFGLNYATNTLGMSRNVILGAIAIGAALELITIPAFGALSDRVGRRMVYIIGSAATAILAFPFFWAVDTTVEFIVIIAFVVGMSIGHGIMYGVQASFLSEMFGTNVRYSGASLGYQIASPVGGGIVPVLAAWIVGASGGETWGVALMMIVISLITILAVYLARETAPSRAKHILDDGSFRVAAAARPNGTEGL